MDIRKINFDDKRRATTINATPRTTVILDKIASLDLPLFLFQYDSPLPLTAVSPPPLPSCIITTIAKSTHIINKAITNAVLNVISS